MSYLLSLLLAQTPSHIIPQTGNSGIDTLVYLLGGLLSLLGLREGTWWIKTLRARKNSSEREGSSDIMWRIAQIQKETLKDLEEARREGREAHARIEATLARIEQHRGN